MNNKSPNGTESKTSFLLGSAVLWKIVIRNNAMDEIMKRTTAMSIGLNSTIEGRMPTKDDAQKTTASIMLKIGIFSWTEVSIELPET